MRYDAVLLDDLGVLSETADGSLLPYVLELRARGVLTAVVSNAGMTGVHHISLARTPAELDIQLV